LASTKKLTYSRAYIAFKEPLGVIEFKEKFDGHAFVNDRGMVFKCNVEFAPWQKVPPQRVKRDPRENTLDQG
jgi:regulator of nonsense transcripts 3